MSIARGLAARARCKNFFFENLRNPAHNRRAGLMRQFSSGQLDSRGSGCRQYQFQITSVCNSLRLVLHKVLCTFGNQFLRTSRINGGRS
jgi:hypothetical protein